MRIPHETPVFETPVFVIADLLQRLGAGEATARDRLVELCEMRIRALANRMLSGLPGAAQCAEDDEAIVVTVRSLHAMLAALDRVPPGLALGLAAAAHERAILSLVDRLQPPLLAGRAGADAAAACGCARWRLFFRCVERLPPLHRQVFRLVWLIGADVEAVSRLTGRSRRTVRRCWREARATVTSALQHGPSGSGAGAPSQA